MRFGIPDHILQALNKELNKRENITRAVIFGSRASDDYKYNSDIDLAVYCEGKLPPGLWVDLDEAAGIYKIDVVDMNSNLDEKLRREIEEQGVEVYRRG
ncbi:nucleotidyltransferase family protein [Syntrophaceticus schinkii]|jgi:predicted nucleotidyltransferase|uniref:Nucleotidyltransferase domain protein n=1 Tax=Syntrophaceticus schinkii TaxID=499207 RepID=A0A0B7MNK6_9FIRM|nr:nucleotidyltransferase domain-containing protein [Syntrophaceticus schinkii]MDD2360456.1 nucleotidyltransferase domain-containing protein [Syntrophaceticus schinkii]CEO89277.1 Nucleotidyltransferase domain protein [Syntrophaceticus schinkii]